MESCQISEIEADPHTHLLDVSLRSNSSGETYCAVPTNELARSSAIPWVERTGHTKEQVRLTTIFKDLPCSKIGNLYPEFVVKQEVFRFEVSGEL